MGKTFSTHVKGEKRTSNCVWKPCSEDTSLDVLDLDKMDDSKMDIQEIG
jgi:hypothetical protein